MAKLGDYVDKYLQLRAKKAAMKARHEAELAPLDQAMAVLEALFKENMDKLGLDSLKTEAGTAYTSAVASVRCADPKAFFDFVQAHDAWHLLEVRPAKTAVQEYVENHKVAPPGVDYSTQINVNVRKG
jgi:hypothetical protein